MPRRIILRGIGVCGLAAFLGGSTACELFQEAGSPTGNIVPPFGVLLRIDNQSGLPAVVDIAFELTSQATRDTRRLLAESGPDAVQDILWTRADRVTVIARVAPDGGASVAVHVGDVLATREYLLNQDYQPGDTIEFVIPSPEPGTEPFPDCNGNGTNDLIDILTAESTDCNENAVPDECDIAGGAAVDSDGNGVPDECGRGACCYPDGHCEYVTEDLCGGVWGAQGSTCTPNLCPQPTGSCCYPDGTCTVTLQANCSETWTMFGVCTPNPCPQPMGACCDPDGTCAVTTEAQCVPTGIWHGDWPSCDPNPCPLLTQACCFANSSCSELIPADCSASGGFSQGDGTTCMTTTCPATEACCFPGNSCSELDPDECYYWGGEPQGPGTTCSTVSCPLTEACCMPSGSCEDLDASLCWIQGGVPQGLGTACWSTTCPYRRRYVNASATGENSGTSWPNAYMSLQSALAEASDPANYVAEIWVAAGVYKPSERLNPDDPRTATFVPSAAVRIFGGFGGWESLLLERDVLDPGKTTVLSGDIGEANDLDDNCYHVVTAFMNQWIGQLDGFTIQEGNADNAAVPSIPGVFGGGVYAAGGSPKIVNCQFINNHSLFGGGGLCVDGTHPTEIPAWVVDCRFTHNETHAAYGPTAGGGGMYVTSVSTSQPVHCVLTNCVFDGNYSLGRGGGLFANALPFYPMQVINCTFVWNSAYESVGRGAALYMPANVANSIFWNNDWNEDETSQLDADSGAFWVTHSCIEGWTGVLDPDGPGNIDDNPLFVDADGVDDVPGNEDDNLRLGYLSPCVDTGENAAVPPDFTDLDLDGELWELVPLDIDLEPRFFQPPTAVIDMGAYEQGGF